MIRSNFNRKCSVVDHSVKTMDYREVLVDGVTTVVFVEHVRKDLPFASDYQLDKLLKAGVDPGSLGNIHTSAGSRIESYGDMSAFAQEAERLMSDSIPKSVDDE